MFNIDIMEANELMVGDHIMFNGSIYQIEEISQNGWVHLTTQGIRVNMSSDYLLEVLEPIQLSTEMLEKNGFKKYDMVSDTYPYNVDEDGNMHYSLMDGDKKVLWGWWQPDGTYLLPSNCTEWITLRYVHELQHILRLVGYEKEIVL